MNSEGRFWCVVWTIVATVILGFMVTIGLNSAYTDTKITEMVLQGIDPQVAACALRGQRSEAVCVLKATK